jgi:hypothetical protein
MPFSKCLFPERMTQVASTGSRPDRPRWHSDKRCAPTVGKHRAISGWSLFFGSLSYGERGSTDCLIPQLLLPLHRRLMSAARNNQLVVLVLAIPGTHRFSDVLLRPLLPQQSFVQKMKHTLRLRQRRVHSGAGFNDHRSTRSSARAVSDNRMRPRIRS